MLHDVAPRNTTVQRIAHQFVDRIRKIPCYVFAFLEKWRRYALPRKTPIGSVMVILSPTFRVKDYTCTNLTISICDRARPRRQCIGLSFERRQTQATYQFSAMFRRWAVFNDCLKYWTRLCESELHIHVNRRLDIWSVAWSSGSWHMRIEVLLRVRRDQGVIASAARPDLIERNRK